MELFVDAIVTEAGVSEVRKQGFNTANVDYFSETARTDVTMVVLKTGRVLYLQMKPHEFHGTLKIAERQDRYYYTKHEN